jgi:hypothetical protein
VNLYCGMRCSRLRLAVSPFVVCGIALYAAHCGERNHASPTPVADAAAIPDAAPEYTRIPYTGLPTPEAGPRTPVNAEFTSTPVRTDTMQLMFAAGEMQTSGEPFASNFAGRVLSYYIFSRYSGTPDQYYEPCTGSNPNCLIAPVIDLFGFSTAVESYEYSKYHMNMIANQSGAGVSLINGPLIASLPGATPFDKLQTRMEALIAATGADIAQYASLPPPLNNPMNDFGFPGLWPNMAAYRSFDVTMTPETDAVVTCKPGAPPRGYGGVGQYGGQAVPRYECDYNTLRLNDVATQAEHVIGPGILGYSTWKEALWAIDFTGRVHDSGNNPVTAVGPQDVTRVGQPGNQVQGVGCPADCTPGQCPTGCERGVYIGSTPLEGMWGLSMVEEMDNAGAWLLTSLATGDGTTLTGVPSVLAAIQYDYSSPLLWFPTAIQVTEQPNSGDGGASDRYPSVAALAIGDATSHSVDLAALAQGYSLFFGMTDGRNAAVGQQVGMQVEFGGSIFAADDALPDGENTAHDRALGVMRLAFVDLDRIHVDPTTGIVVDTATVAGGTVMPGTAVTTTALGHVVVGLRHLLMACNASVSQYGAPDGDATKDALGILNSVPIHPPVSDGGPPPSFSARVRQVLMNQAQFVRDTLTSSDGSVRNGAELAGGQWVTSSDATALEAQSAALRVLVEAGFLSPDDTSYNERARAVARTLLTAFWSDPARMFRGQAGGADDVVMTPERFAWLQQALRETYEAIWVPGDPLLDRAVLEDRIARVNKLYLNGWDDLNGDQKVDKPTECLAARLQLGEQALTGEVATNNNGYPILQGSDAEKDCVLNIAYTNTASVLAGEVHFHSP